MKANISFSKESLTDAFKLHYNKKYPIKSRLMLIAGLALIAIGFIFVAINFAKNLPLLRHIITLVGLAYVLLFFYRRKKLFERAANQKTFQGTFTFELNKHGLAFGKKNGVSKCAWNKIIDIIEDENSILFYFGKDKFYILPLQSLTEEQIQGTKQQIKKFYGEQNH